MGRHGSFSKAASELHFTQSAVSQQIATLERDLGAALVHRNPVALTEAGAVLCRRYESAVAELAAARAELKMFREGGGGRVRIAASAGSVGTLLTRAIAAVSSGEEGLEVAVRALSPTMSIEALARGEADVAVTYRFDLAGPADTRVRAASLMRDRLILAVPRGHALASRNHVGLAELAGESWIHVPDLEVPRAVIDEALQGRPYQPKVLVENGDLRSAHALVAAGVGIALLPELCRAHDPDVEHVHVSGNRVGRSIYAAVRCSAPQDSGVAQLLDALTSAARRMTMWPLPTEALAPPLRLRALR